MGELPVVDVPSPKVQLKVYGDIPPVAVAENETVMPGDGTEGE